MTTKMTSFEAVLCMFGSLASAGMGELGYFPDRFVTWCFALILFGCFLSWILEVTERQRSG